MNEIKLFKNQPLILETHLANLTKRGLLKAPTGTETGPRRTAKITYKNAGELVSYEPFATILKNESLTQDDARRLLVIEAMRPNGRPRKSHVDRLMVLAFATDKSDVLSKINSYSEKQWRKNQK